MSRKPRHLGGSVQGWGNMRTRAGRSTGTDYPYDFFFIYRFKAITSGMCAAKKCLGGDLFTYLLTHSI